MHDDREAPLRRISTTTGTTEQLHSGMGTRPPPRWRLQVFFPQPLEDQLRGDEHMNDAGQEQGKQEHGPFSRAGALPC